MADGILSALGQLVPALISAIRDDGADLDEIVRRIKTPRQLDMSFRDQIDERLKNLKDDSAKENENEK